MIGEKPMQTLSDRKATTQTHLQNIPPVVYQTWEVDYFGKTHFAEIEKFRDLNPDLSGSRGCAAHDLSFSLRAVHGFGGFGSRTCVP